MIQGAHKRLGFSAIGGRQAKAEKIVAILAAAGRPLKPTDELLDLGCGSGEIAEHLSALSTVICADAIDQRTHGLNLPFHQSTGTLPFPDASFDLVISNHVIEHTGDPDRHLSEIRRIARPGAMVYLATPNRLWPWEVHARLPILHYLPAPFFSRVGIALGRLHEPLQLLSLRRLEQLCHGRFTSEVWHHRILRDADRYALRLPATLKTLLGAAPPALLSLTAPLQPTLIILLTPK